MTKAFYKLTVSVLLITLAGMLLRPSLAVPAAESSAGPPRDWIPGRA